MVLSVSNIIEILNLFADFIFHFWNLIDMKMVEFCDLVRVAIAPVSRKPAVKCFYAGMYYLKSDCMIFYVAKVEFLEQFGPI